MGYRVCCLNTLTVMSASLPVILGKKAAPGFVSLINADAVDLHAEMEEGKDSIHQELARAIISCTICPVTRNFLC